MCDFKSGLIFKNRVILAPMYNDSHSALLRSLNIEDNHMNASKMFVRAELIPPKRNKTADISEWKFKVDQDIVPDWYKNDTSRYEQKFRAEVKAWMEERFKVICKELCVKIKENKIGTYYMTADILFQSEFGKTNNYAESGARKKLLESDFAKALQEEYGDKLVPITTNLLSLEGFDDYGIIEGDILAVRTFDLNRECRKSIPNPDTWEWLSTPTVYGSGNVQYVGDGGNIGYGWCGDVGGVRPFFICGI